MAETSTTESSGLDVLAKTGTTAKPGITNQGILADMQKLYDQKLAEKNYFMQDLADASAWWSGGAAGPSAGLAQRAQTRAAQSKQLEDLQAQLSQGKVNLAQLGEANTSMGEPQAGVSGLPTGGAPTQGGAQAPAGAPAGGYTIRGVPVPIQVFKAYQAYIKQGNLAKANEVFDAYAKEETKFLTAPGSYKQEDYFDEKAGEMKRRTPLEVRGGVTPIPTARSALVANAEAPSAPVANAPMANAPSAPVAQADTNDIYRFENLGDAAKQRLNEYAKTELGLKGDTMNRADASELFNKMPMEQRKNAFLKAGETPVVAQASAPTQMPTAPTQMLASTTGGKPASYSDYLSRQAGEKNYQEQTQTAAGKAAGTRQGSFESAAVDASKDLQNANVMLNIMDKYPEAVGFGYKNRALGTAIEGVKLITGKDIEPLARRAALSPEAIEAGNKFDSLAETNNLKFRQMVYKGTGQVSDFETKLSERASGLARDNSLEANRFFATVAAENYRTMDKLGKDWQAFQAKNPGATFAKFEQSETWKNAQAERENRLKQYFPEIERGDLGFGSKAPTTGANTKELEGWRQRYGTKKEIQ
jgi:hypothetical protein